MHASYAMASRWGRLAAQFMTFCCLLAVVLVSAPAIAAPLPALQSVPAVDLERFQGRWYQVALYPNYFQRDCVSNTTADYTLMADGSVMVFNQCRQADGTNNQIVGAARIAQPRKTLFNWKPLPSSSSRLEVRFAPKWLSFIKAVWAPYWVIQLADDYRYAVISEPDRQFLWILSRTPTLNPQDEAIIKGLLQQQGFDTTLLRNEIQD